MRTNRRTRAVSSATANYDVATAASLQAVSPGHARTQFPSKQAFYDEVRRCPGSFGLMFSACNRGGTPLRTQLMEHRSALLGSLLYGFLQQFDSSDNTRLHRLWT